MPKPSPLPSLLREVARCQICAASLSHGVRPVLQAAPEAKILIAGQAPGRRVHETGIPFDDPSGARLRHWLGLSREQFYDPGLVSILPMSFCFPGTGKSGDLPPLPACAEAWRQPILNLLPGISIQIILGRYALAWHRPAWKALKLEDAIRLSFAEDSKDFVLPHPSPRNNIWLKKNAWFEAEVLPQLQKKINSLLKRD